MRLVCEGSEDMRPRKSAQICQSGALIVPWTRMLPFLIHHGSKDLGMLYASKQGSLKENDEFTLSMEFPLLDQWLNRAVA